MGRRSRKPDAFPSSLGRSDGKLRVPEADIARVIGIDPKPLRRHYRNELDTGQIKATAKVAEFLFRKATTDGSQAVTAAIFWLKTRGAGGKRCRIIASASSISRSSPTPNSRA